MTVDWKASAKRTGQFLLERSQERSSVAGLVATLSTILGVALPPGEAAQIVSAIIVIGGLIATFMPGGK